MSVRVVVAVFSSLVWVAACSPIQHPSAAFLEQGVPVLEYKRCSGVEGIRDVSVYLAGNDTKAPPVWVATLRDRSLASVRIPFADEVPGYDVTERTTAYRSDQMLTVIARDLRSDRLGGPEFSISNLIEGRALTSLGFDGSTSYTPAETWRRDLSDCPDSGWILGVIFAVIAVGTTLTVAIFDRRRRRPVVVLPIPPPPIRP